MSYAFSDQQSKLSSLLGDPNTATDDQWPLATRKKEINRGEWKFALDSKLSREYATGTISSLEISMPADFLEIFSLYIVVSAALYRITNDREISVKDLERHWQHGGDIPFYYFSEFSGTKKIKFLGSSGNNGRTYHLYYIRKPTTELSGDTDTSIHPEEFREASVYYAASELMRQIGKNEIADRYYARYLEYVHSAKERASKLYLDYDYPRPDMNIGDTIVSDFQGGGQPF